MKFLDQVDIFVESGKGGAGSISFRREKFVPRGGPDGGDGGKGGDLIFRVNPGLNTLLHISHKKNYKAQNGEAGSGNLRSGASGEDLVIDLPEGTLVKDANGEVLLDLKTQGDYLFLKGGRGGKGNNHFKSSVNQAPNKAQPGEEGEKKHIFLELQLMADIGLVGYPNAGKSTLISVISAAKPKVADYPFTTLTPSLGMVSDENGKSFVVADIPGLIPGAHKGVGLGTQFLRHIERTKVLLHLVDVSPYSGRDPLQDWRDITTELAEYDKAHMQNKTYKTLLDRKQIVVLNKIDTISEAETEAIVSSFTKEGLHPLLISAVSKYGLRELKFKLSNLLYGDDENENE